MAKYFIFKNDTGENPVNLFKIASSDEEKNFIINNRQFQMNSIVVSDNDFNNAKLKLRSGYVTTDYANFTSTPNDVIKTNSQIFIEFDLPILLENIQRYIYMNSEPEKQSYMQGWKEYLSTLRGLNTTTFPKHFDFSFENYLNSLGINSYNYNYQSY